MLRQTKFYRPSTPQDLVVRSRLFDLIEQGLSRPLTLVSAPAGYGKTMLVSSFLQTCALPWAWLSLDEGDNDLRLFVDYLHAALESMLPGSLRGTRLLLAGPSLPPVAVIADSLINELAELERESILVLDDVHAIHETDIFSLLLALLRHPLQGLHLMLLGRQDPPLGLGLLRARDQVSEIRARDLRFTAEETAEFMDDAVSMHLSDEALVLLAEQTEGWVVGLRLAALTLLYGGTVESQVAESNATNRYVLDFLLGEVLSRVPPDVEDFLLKTSILDALCGPLCDAVMGADSMTGRGQSLLQMLEETNLFTVALDEKRHWYRYHHLFQLLLHSELMRKFDVEAIDALHHRASAWYASHDSLELALEHALAGHDIPAAVRLVAQHRHDLLNTEQRPRLERWLWKFASTTVAQQPELLLAWAWTAEFGRFGSQTVLDMTDQAQLLVNQMVGQPEYARILQGEIDALWAIEKTFAANDAPGVIVLASRALEAMPVEWHMVRTETWLQLAVAYSMTGELERAYAAMIIAQEETANESGAPYARAIAASCFIHWLAADLTGVLLVAQRTAKRSQISKMSETSAWAHYFLASAHFLRNDLSAAALHANAVLAQRYASHPYAVIHASFILSAISHVRGVSDQARLVLDQLSAFLIEVKSERLQWFVDAFGVELAALHGDLETAGRWATEVGAKIPLGVMAFHYAPQLTLPKVLLRMNTPASVRQATEALARLHTFVTTTHNTRFTIDVLALQALCFAAESEELAALHVLEQAVALAEPGGFIRVFVDLGPVMAGLLERLAQRGGSPTYIRQILNAFAAMPAPADHPHPLSGSLASQAGLVEPLTSRELDVLELLAQRLSAKEIAQRLTITERTVSRHTANIYLKLGANNRREATRAAIELGILPVQ